jgi:NADPH2:quinone reductase
MKAMVIDCFGGAEQLHLEEMPTPKPADNEVLIEVCYAAVNPVDWKIREGHLKGLIPHEFPIILGWDASGTIADVGKNVSGFHKGDEIFAYCRKPIVKWGTYAEFVSFDAANIALKPKNISFAQAAAIPLAGLTAWQALFDFAHLKAGESILIHAGAGGVGGLAIEFARQAGAKIYTTASQENHGYVKKLGAHVPIDYRRDNFVAKIRSLEPQGIDIVLDCVGKQTLQDSFQVLKPNGRIVSIVEQVDQGLAKKYNVHGGFVFVKPNGKQLSQIADLIAEGKVVPPNIEEMPFTSAASAHEKIRQGHTRGKYVLRIKR